MNILSIVSLNRSSSILGNRVSSSLDDSSIHGLVLTSISQTDKSWSSIKSRPNNSKQFLRLKGFSFFETEWKAMCAYFFIFGRITLSKSTPSFFKYCLRSLNPSWFPSSSRPYSGLFFYIALFVRWT